MVEASAVSGRDEGVRVEEERARLGRQNLAGHNKDLALTLSEVGATGGF